MSAANPVRVLIADSQPLFSAALGIALGLEPDIKILPFRPDDAVDVLEKISMHKPDVCLIDAWINGMEGPIIARAIREKTPATKVILLSWFHSPQHIRQALNAGAQGFLTKSLDVAQVADAIRRVHGGESPLYWTELQALSERIDERAKAREEVVKKLVTLTPQEIRILSLLSAGHTVHDIAAKLFVTVGTVRVHVNKILRKTGTVTQLEAVALWLGQRMPDSEPPG